MKTMKILSLFVAVTALAACSEKDNWTPGPQTAPDCPKVYFVPAETNVTPEATYFDLTVARVNTSAAISVPIHIVSAPEGLTFPDGSVTFAAGQETALFRMNIAPSLKYETDYPFVLKVDEAYADQYSTLTPGFAGKLRRLEPWVLVAEMNCTFEGRSGSKLAKFDPFKQNLYKKEIAGMFKIEDWCLNGTGEPYGDLIFTVDEKKQLIPDASVGYHAVDAKRWYFYTPDATSDDASFQINGHLPTSTGAYMTYFYLYTVGSTDSRYALDFDEEAKTARLGGYSRYSSSAFSSGAFYLHYEWSKNEINVKDGCEGFFLSPAARLFNIMTMMKKYLWLLPVFLLVVSVGFGCTPSDSGESPDPKPGPGPKPTKPPIIRGYGDLHVMHRPAGAIRVLAARMNGSVLDTIINSIPDDLKFHYYSRGDGTDVNFEFTLHDQIPRSWRISPPERTLAVSDFHGRLDALVAVLRGNGVVDADLNWTFGKNVLIVLGDMLDRGRDDNGVTWLVYRLERQAEDAGGRVDFVPGNHEDLVMKNDLRYVHAAHTEFSKKAGTGYSELYGKTTELGRWLRDKHLMLALGGNLFVHAGLSTAMSNGKYSPNEINERGRRWLGYPNKDRNAADGRNEALFGSDGVIWYRGLVTNSAPISSDDLDDVLRYYAASRIIVGHSEVSQTEWRYDGRVVAINVSHANNYPANRTAGILIEGGAVYSVTYSGEKKLLSE